MAIDAICQRGSIRDSDVAMLRRAFALETQIAASDIDALFRAHNLARVRDRSWSDFFVETLTDYVVRELEPSGYVTAAHAGWLIARVSSAGQVRTKTEHDLLLNVIDKARWVPESLMTFTLGQIRDAVLTGEGALRAGTGIGAGAIALNEVEQIRSLLFAYGNEGPREITQAELDVLLDIEEAITASEAHDGEQFSTSPLDAWPLESWRDLIVKAVVNAVMAASGHAGPTREEALSEARPLLGAAGATAADGSARTGIVAAYAPLLQEARALLRLELQRIEIITGEPVRFADPARLAHRLWGAPLAGSPASRVLDVLCAAGIAIDGRLTGHALQGAA
jgi:hypothetical protein